MYNRIYNYLTKHQLLYNKQFGFHSNNSTDHAILHLVDDISNAFDRGEFTLGVFIDLSKALFLLTYLKNLTAAMSLRSTQPFFLSRSINEYQHTGVSGLN